MKVFTYKSNGKVYWSIASKRYIPFHSLVSHYLQVKLGNRSVNTRKRKACELLFALKYFQKRNVDVIGNIEEFCFLNDKDINLFFRSCKLKRNIMVQHDGTILTKSALSNLIARNQPTENIVGEGTAKGRINTFIDFYKYIFNRRHGRSILTIKQKAEYDQCLIDLSTAARSMGSWQKRVSDPFKSGLSDEKYFELLDIIKASSNNNPFTSSKFRNELIIKLFIETGLRRGAVAKLKISDVFNDRVPRIRVTRTPDDITDPRRFRASQKTKAHVSPISRELGKDLEYYIREVRSKLLNAEHHEFVFVTEKNCRGTSGKPLSLRSYNNIFKKLSEALEVTISPHTLRYKWNELFDSDMNNLAREMGFDSKAIEDIRKYAMGWSAKSEMAEVYNNFKLASMARDYHLARQRELGAKFESHEDEK